MCAESIYKSLAGERAVMAAYDAVLGCWPVPCEMRTIPTRHGDAFVIASGQGSASPLVLLHGAGANSAMWDGDIVEYSRHYRVYAVDLLGEPGKSAPSRPAWDGPAYAEWLDDVLAALEVEKAALLGISQGGWTALKFAAYQPERVEQFIILIMTNFRPRIGLLPLFSDEELRRLTMPVLLLVGARDALRDGDKIAARMQKLVPDLTATIIPGAGHALFGTTPQVMPFLSATSQ